VRLRVLHLITRLPVGGAERLLVDVVRSLDRERFESLVCCIQDKGPLADELEAGGVPVFCLERMRSKRFDFGAVGAIARLLKEQRIDVLHSHLYHANLYGRLAAWRAGVPAVATVHNTYTRVKLHRSLLNRLLTGPSTRVVAVSEDVRRDLIRHDRIPAERIMVIHNGIDTGRVRSSLSREAARARLGIPADAIAVGCVARLEEQKGHRFLLEALNLLGEPRFLAVIAGDGRLRGELERRAAELGVAGQAMFLGTRSDVADILRALDIYAMPSLWEGLSIAMLESMAAGLPIVISDVSGVAQVIGDDEFGMKVPVGDPAALAKAIRLLADDPRRRAALGAAARERVEARFSVGAMAAQLARLYEDVSSRRP